MAASQVGVGVGVVVVALVSSVVVFTGTTYVLFTVVGPLYVTLMVVC